VLRIFILCAYSFLQAQLFACSEIRQVKEEIRSLKEEFLTELHQTYRRIDTATIDLDHVRVNLPHEVPSARTHDKQSFARTVPASSQPDLVSPVEPPLRCTSGDGDGQYAAANGLDSFVGPKSQNITESFDVMEGIAVAASVGIGAASVLKEVISGSGLPFADSTIRLIDAVISAYQKDRLNDVNCREISRKLEHAVNFMKEVHVQDLETAKKAKKHLQVTLQSTEMEVYDTFSAAQIFIQRYRSQNFVLRLLLAQSHKDNFDDVVDKIDKLVQRFSLEKLVSRLPVEYKFPEEDKQMTLNHFLLKVTGLDFKKRPRETMVRLQEKLARKEVDRADLVDLFGDSWERELKELERSVRLQSTDQGRLLNIPLPIYEYWMLVFGSVESVLWDHFYDTLTDPLKSVERGFDWGTDVDEAGKLEFSEDVLRFYFNNSRDTLHLFEFAKFSHLCLKWQREIDIGFDVDALTMKHCFLLLRKKYDRNIDHSIRLSQLLVALDLDKNVADQFGTVRNDAVLAEEMYDPDTTEWLDELWKKEKGGGDWRILPHRHKEWLRGHIDKKLRLTHDGSSFERSNAPDDKAVETSYLWIVGDPFIGKSTYAAHFADLDKKFGGIIKAQLFCAHSSVSLDVFTMIKLIAYQLAQSLGDEVFDYIVQKATSLVGSNEKHLLDKVAKRLLLQPLQYARNELNMKQPIVILIDGIDATAPSHNSSTPFWGADRSNPQFTSKALIEKVFMSPEFESFERNRGFKFILTCRQSSLLFATLQEERAKKNFLGGYSDVLVISKEGSLPKELYQFHQQDIEGCLKSELIIFCPQLKGKKNIYWYSSHLYDAYKDSNDEFKFVQELRSFFDRHRIYVNDERKLRWLLASQYPHAFPSQEVVKRNIAGILLDACNVLEADQVKPQIDKLFDAYNQCDDLSNFLPELRSWLEKEKKSNATLTPKELIEAVDKKYDRSLVLPRQGSVDKDASVNPLLARTIKRLGNASFEAPQYDRSIKFDSTFNRGDHVIFCEENATVMFEGASEEWITAIGTQKFVPKSGTSACTFSIDVKKTWRMSDVRIGIITEELREKRLQEALPMLFSIGKEPIHMTEKPHNNYNCYQF
jgi:hypothetical protein